MSEMDALLADLDAAEEKEERLLNAKEAMAGGGKNLSKVLLKERHLVILP